jgi:hypothetical protein
MGTLVTAGQQAIVKRGFADARLAIVKTDAGALP